MLSVLLAKRTVSFRLFWGFHEIHLFNITARDYGSKRRSTRTTYLYVFAGSVKLRFRLRFVVGKIVRLIVRLIVRIERERISVYYRPHSITLLHTHS